MLRCPGFVLCKAIEPAQRTCLHKVQVAAPNIDGDCCISPPGLCALLLLVSKEELLGLQLKGEGAHCVAGGALADADLQHQAEMQAFSWCPGQGRSAGSPCLLCGVALKACPSSRHSV